VANVAVTVTPLPTPFPFIIPGGWIQVGTAIPIQRLTYKVSDQTIALKAAGDTTSIVVNCNLPPNFAYTWEYTSADIVIPTEIGDASQFDAVGSLILAFGDNAGTRVSAMSSNGFGRTLLNVGSIQTWAPENPYARPIFNQNGSTPVISVHFNDINAAETAEGDFSCLVTVLQYELDQVFAYPLNFPLPVAAQ